MNTGNQPLLLRPSGKDYLWGLKMNLKRKSIWNHWPRPGSVLLTQMGQVTSPVVYLMV